MCTSNVSYLVFNYSDIYNTEKKNEELNMLIIRKEYSKIFFVLSYPCNKFHWAIKISID